VYAARLIPRALLSGIVITLGERTPLTNRAVFRDVWVPESGGGELYRVIGHANFSFRHCFSLDVHKVVN
jgi:hypothetical protein